MGRYYVPGLLWYHQAWERSEEYQDPLTTITERHKYIDAAVDIIEAMTTSPYYEDISQIGDECFKGGDRSGVQKWMDGKNGWGNKGPLDALVALPNYNAGEDEAIYTNQWYKVKIRAENIPTTDNTRLSVWFVESGHAFPVDPYYEQVYDGVGWSDGQMKAVEDKDGDRILFTTGTVALLSSMSNIDYRNITVYKGVPESVS